VRENRLRRMAERQGMRLEKSRRRDPRALEFGTYQLVDIRMNAIVHHNSATGVGYGLDLDDVEDWLTGKTQEGWAKATGRTIVENG
jgi:hypothetical protein